MGKQRELRSQWQRVCKLILAEADVAAVSRALGLALFMDAKLDVYLVTSNPTVELQTPMLREGNG